MTKHQKQAFTLVELIVVITILAILWTIAFISFWNFSRDARDSARISDLKNISKSLELYALRNWNYPLPQDSTQITYSWWTENVWIQGIFWEETRTTIGQSAALSKVPLDPLTQTEYTYSLLNTWLEYELWAITEGELVNNTNTLTNQTYAAWTELAQAYTLWNYNQVAVKTTNCVLAVPSIITSDTSITDLQTIINNSLLIYKWYKNLPSAYSWTTFNTLWDPTLVLSNQVEAYCWNLWDLSSNETTRLTMFDNLQAAYTGTAIETSSASIAQVLSATTPSAKASLSATIVNNILNGSATVTQTETSWATCVFGTSTFWNCNL